jgi:hypothetical protein
MPPKTAESPVSTAVGEQIGTETLNYGVELEFLFAFHESRLDLEGTNGELDELAKDLSYSVRENKPFTLIGERDLLHHVYNSWGIMKGGASPPVPYNTQPQEILGFALHNQCEDIPFAIHDTMSMNDKLAPQYDKWFLCKNHRVCGVGSKNIFPGRLAHRLYDEEPAKWDSVGLEAVSQVYNTEEWEVSGAEIKSVVTALKGTERDTYGSFITNRE